MILRDEEQDTSTSAEETQEEQTDAKSEETEDSTPAPGDTKGEETEEDPDPKPEETEEPKPKKGEEDIRIPKHRLDEESAKRQLAEEENRFLKQQLSQVARLEDEERITKIESETGESRETILERERIRKEFSTIREDNVDIKLTLQKQELRQEIGLKTYDMIKPALDSHLARLPRGTSIAPGIVKKVYHMALGELQDVKMREAEERGRKKERLDKKVVGQTSFTGGSKPQPKKSKIVLSEKERTMARKSNMTDEEWVKNRDAGSIEELLRK